MLEEVGLFVDSQALSNARLCLGLDLRIHTATSLLQVQRRTALVHIGGVGAKIRFSSEVIVNGQKTQPQRTFQLGTSADPRDTKYHSNPS